MHQEKSREHNRTYPPPPFPQRLANNKKKEKDEDDVLKIFSKVEINIPLIEAIKQIPKYSRFLKELCTQKRRSRGKEKMRGNASVSAIIHHEEKKLPEKCIDPGIFLIPCTLGDTSFKAMIDLGASINVMPSSIFASLNMGMPKQTSVVIQLADSSHAFPRGVIEDVLVQVKQLIFPADFYILDMENDTSTPIILGRPFLKTAKTKIDVHNGTLTMEFDGDVAEFNIANDAALDSSLCVINAFEFMVQEEEVKLQDDLVNDAELEAILGLMELGESSILEKLQSNKEDETTSLLSSLFQQEKMVLCSQEKEDMQQPNDAQKEERPPPFPPPHTSHSSLLLADFSSSPSSPSPLDNSDSLHMVDELFNDFDDELLDLNDFEDYDDLDSFDEFRNYRDFMDVDEIEHVDFIFKDEPHVNNIAQIRIVIGIGFMRIIFHLPRGDVLILLVSLALHSTCLAFLKNLKIHPYGITLLPPIFVYDPG